MSNPSLNDQTGLTPTTAVPTTSKPVNGTQSNLNVMAHSITAPLQPIHSFIRGMGEEVFNCKDVHIYFIKPGQNVATQSNSAALRIVTIPQDQQNLVSENPQPPAFLEVGGWMYPLIPSHSPVYRSPEGHYMFPDLLSDSPGASVGLILSSSMTNDDRETFEMILLNLSGRESFPSPPEKAGPLTSVQGTQNHASAKHGRKNSTEGNPLEPKSSHLCAKIAVGMMAVAEGASRGLSLGAMKTAELVDKGAVYIKTQLPIATRPTHIEPEIKEAVIEVNSYTGKVVELSSIFLSKLGEATSALASYAAYYCQSTATQLAVKYGGQSEGNTKDCVDGILEISEGALNAMGMVYGGLHDAARILANSITSNTIDVVEYCYGPEAGEIAEIAADTVGNVTMVGVNVNSANPQKVLIRAARDTGRAMFVKTSDPPDLNNLSNLKF